MLNRPTFGGHIKSRGFVYTKKRMHRFDKPSFFCLCTPYILSGASTSLRFENNNKVRFLSVDRHQKSVPYYCYLPIDYNTTGRKATAASPF